MSLDIATLRVLKYRDRYERLRRAIPDRALDARTRVLLADYGRFFRQFPDAPRVDRGMFGTYFKTLHPKLSDEDFAVYDGLFKQIDIDASETTEAGLMRRLVEVATAYDTATLLEKFNNGEDIDLRSNLSMLLDEYDKQVDRKVVNRQVLDPIEDLLKAEEDDTGFHWRLDCLNRHIKPLVGGDFVVVAARPDKGKTTFVASELTYMAAQVDALYPGEDRSILWLNNEGPGKRIVTRCFQSALNATTEELVALAKAGTIRQDYAKALGGRGGTLRIFDIHGDWNYEVEDLIRQWKPAGIVFDMIDNIRFGGETINGGQRTDQLLENQYQWARQLGVKLDCFVMATSQISADGDGMQWPTLPMLKDSKTGKQGAADVIITIGTVNDPVLVRDRYIGTTKNKKVRTGVPASPMANVIFDGDRGRYVEGD